MIWKHQTRTNLASVSNPKNLPSLWTFQDDVSELQIFVKMKSYTHFHYLPVSLRTECRNFYCICNLLCETLFHSTLECVCVCVCVFMPLKTEINMLYIKIISNLAENTDRRICKSCTGKKRLFVVRTIRDIRIQCEGKTQICRVKPAVHPVSLGVNG